MPTPEAEEITKAAWAEMSGAHYPDALTFVQKFAPQIDALVLRKVVEMEASWRNSLQLERDVRAAVEKDRRRYRYLRTRFGAEVNGALSEEDWNTDAEFDAGVDKHIDRYERSNLKA